MTPLVCEIFTFTLVHMDLAMVCLYTDALQYTGRYHSTKHNKQHLRL